MTLINNKFTRVAGVAIAYAVMSACSGTDVSNPPPLNSGPASSGNADFTTFVAIGDSLTAGYADGALYLLGQQNSYPNILAQQFRDVGGLGFAQPLIADPATDTPEKLAEANLGGLLVNGTPGLIENRFVLDTQTEKPVRIGAEDNPPVLPTIDVVGTGLNGMTFNNMGVPGAASFHLLSNTYGDLLSGKANPYFVRFARTTLSTMIGDAAAQQPSFYVLWIGNIDTLAYATSGGTGVDRDGSNLPDDLDPSKYGPNDITNPNVFAGTYQVLVDAMSTANPAVQGVLINLPDVASIPFFTTVPYNAIPLTAEEAADLNDAYAPYNGGVAAMLEAQVIDADEAALRTITFAEGQNGVVIFDEDLTDLTPINSPATDGLVNMRQANENDLILLTAASVIGTEAVPGDETTVFGVGIPLGDELVLIPSELSAIGTARSAFNGTIKAIADDDPNLVFVDAANLMGVLKQSGIDYGTGSISSDFATGGAFSLDGVHPTARGYSVIANAIIDEINSGFDANVYKVDPANYTTVFLK